MDSRKGLSDSGGVAGGTRIDGNGSSGDLKRRIQIIILPFLSLVGGEFGQILTESVVEDTLPISEKISPAGMRNIRSWCLVKNGGLKEDVIDKGRSDGK